MVLKFPQDEKTKFSTSNIDYHIFWTREGSSWIVSEIDRMIVIIVLYNRQNVISNFNVVAIFHKKKTKF